ncbi:type III-B CRISPR module RAMP protein Cmr1 [Persephonella sp.]|uniref:type III-B CRISPR module RAMP protein Cmr1 n=1 Tax=Persephonella sp. TaxID=2060922 RepID=UPI002611E0E7|nr:type III-B CRISPR module RAMP protein Cmr1 [Persephonella sp.]
MEKITFECEIITPMFMYGGDGKTLELRPSEFKGMLRFWFRALHPELPIPELKRKENEIFGSTDRKGSFRIKVEQITSICRYHLLPHKNRANIPAYAPHQKFNIEFLFQNLKNKETIKNLFILSTIIGGFGRRSRRGFGSIRISRINNTEFDYANLQFIEGIQELIKSINPNFKFNFRKEKKEENYPFIRNVEIGNIAYSSYDEILKHIGQMTHDCRCGKAKVFSNIDRFVSPCYVSVIKKDKEYYPIITSLNIALPDNQKVSKEQLNTITNFKNSILQKKNLC